MGGRISRRAFLTALASSVAVPAFASAPEQSLRPVLRPMSIRQQAGGGVDGLVAAAQLKGDVEFAVVDVTSGKILEQSQTLKGLPPASVTKAITALYALDTLGPSHRFQTVVMADGAIEGSVLKGNLYLVGGGDPTLNTDHMNLLAKTLAGTGIKSITGRFLVYGGALPYVETIDGGQPVYVGYSPAISGLCLNFNRVYFDWKRVGSEFKVAMDARSEKLRPPVRVASVSLSDRKGPVYKFDGSGKKDRWSVARSSLNNEGGRWLPVRQPEIYCGEVFQWLSATHGVRLPAPVKSTSKPKGRVVASHSSDHLLSILRGMLRYSTNITAEMVGLSTTLARGNYVANLRASGRAMSDWAAKELGMTRSKFVDHSGLGDQSRAYASEFALGLARAKRKAVLHPILRDFTMRSRDGKPIKNHPIKVQAKTGTLNFVSGLGGYLTTRNGHEMAFAIFAGDLGTRNALTRAERVRPPGARTYNGRAKRLQQALIERWGDVYAS